MSRFRPSSRTRQAGFTLMELMVVLALIAILSAAILPEMRGSFEDAVLRSSARQVVDVFSLANARAVSLSQAHRVRFDPAAGRYSVEAQSGRSARRGPFTPVPDLTGGTGTLDPRVHLEIHPSGGSLPAPEIATPAGSANSIAFYPDGTSDAAELRLQDNSGFALLLRLNPVTSRVQITTRGRP
jgi:type II secretion system protein H